MDARIGFSPDGSKLAAFGRFPLRILDADSGRVIAEQEGNDLGSMTGPAWSVDGARVAAVDRQFAYVWDLAPPATLRRLRLPAPPPAVRFPARAVAISPDGATLAVATTGTDHVLLYPLPPHPAPATAPAAAVDRSATAPGAVR